MMIKVGPWVSNPTLSAIHQLVFTSHVVPWSHSSDT